MFVNGFYLLKRPNGCMYLARYEWGQIISAALITPAVWDKLAEMQRRLKSEYDAWNKLEPLKYSQFCSDWSGDFVKAVKAIRRSGYTGGRVMGVYNMNVDFEEFYLDTGMAAVADKKYRKDGWPFWYDPKEFRRSLAVLG